MRASTRLLPAAALCGAGLLAGACASAGDADPSSGATDYLADQTDVLAERIADDQPCEAIDHAERLVTRTWATVSNGELSTATAAHVEQVVGEVVDQLVCEEPGELTTHDGSEEPDDLAEPDDQDGVGGQDDRGEASDPAPRESGPNASDGGDSSTSGRGSDPPGQGNGRGGRDGAPRQNHGSSGRGGGRS